VALIEDEQEELQALTSNSTAWSACLLTLDQDSTRAAQRTKMLTFERRHENKYAADTKVRRYMIDVTTTHSCCIFAHKMNVLTFMYTIM
jgi:hypothetical protein